MIFRRPLSRWTLWVFAAALLLKAAMPYLATASAQWQGKQLVEVCTVYGVTLVPLDGGKAPAAPAGAPTHAGDHCALNGLPALATGGPSGVLPWPVTTALASPPMHRAAASRIADACAAWATRLRHGPPSFA